MTQSLTDSQLWNAFRLGDRRAFELMYDRYVQVLYNYGCKLNSDQDLVQDLIQDLFIEIWHSRERLGPTDSIKYYLFRSLRRKIARATEKLQLQDTIDGSTNSASFGMTLDYESELTDRQSIMDQKAQLDRAVGQLTRRQKEAIFLKFYQGMSYEEVASVMGLEMKSTYNLVSRSLDILRVYLKQTVVILSLLLTTFIAAA